MLRFAGCIAGVACGQHPQVPASTPEPVTVTPTGDTGSTTTWAGIYPRVDFDCGLGAPAGPYDTETQAGVWTTEGLAFDLDGGLVAWDRQGNAVAYDTTGAVTILGPAVGESRAVALLGNGDIAYTSGDQPFIGALERGTGGRYTVATVDFAGLAGLDIAADGTIATCNLSGKAYVIAPDGAITDFGRVSPQLYGVAFSADDNRIFWSGYSLTDPHLYVSERKRNGTWSEPEVWVTLEGSSLSGIAVDACDNLYVVRSFGCQVYRITPTGEVTELIDLDPGRNASCPNLAFGRGLGGWDPYTLYISTYEEVVGVDVGIPGKPR